MFHVKGNILVLDQLRTLWGLHWRLQPLMVYHVQPYFGLWNPRPNFHCGKRDVILRKPKSRIISRARNNSFTISSICQSFIKTHFQFGVLHYMEKWNTVIIDMPEDGACQMALAQFWRGTLSWQLQVLRSLRGTEGIQRLCIQQKTLFLVTSVFWSIVRHETWSKRTYVMNEGQGETKARPSDFQSDAVSTEAEAVIWWPRPLGHTWPRTFFYPPSYGLALFRTGSWISRWSDFSLCELSDIISHIIYMCNVLIYVNDSYGSKRAKVSPVSLSPSL